MVPMGTELNNVINNYKSEIHFFLPWNPYKVIVLTLLTVFHFNSFLRVCFSVHFIVEGDQMAVLSKSMLFVFWWDGLILSFFGILILLLALYPLWCLSYLSVANKDDWKTKRQRLFRNLSIAATALVTSLPNSKSKDSSEESKKESASSVTSSPPQASAAIDCTDGRDIIEGQGLSKRRRGIQELEPKLKLKKEGKFTNKSKVYFVALFWGILLSRLWLHWDYIMILLLPATFYALKQLFAYWGSSITSSSLWVFIISQWEKLKSWANERKQALIPTQLSSLFKGGIKVDRTVS